MQSTKLVKKVTSKVASSVLALLLLISQTLPFPSSGLAQDVILDPATGIPMATVSATTTSTQTSTETETQTPTSTEWMSEGPLSTSESQPSTTVDGAYQVKDLGAVKADDLEGNNYVITAENGTRLTPSNEVPEVKVQLTYNYTQKVTVMDDIDIIPYYSLFNYDTKQWDRHFVTLQSGQTAVLSDSIYGSTSLSRMEEPLETVPNFVMVNGVFTPLTLKPRYAPVSGKAFELSFVVPNLKADGTDKIKFISPYDGTRTLVREYALTHDASLWVRIEPSLAEVTLFSKALFEESSMNGVKSFATGIASSEKILDYHFNQDGSQLVITTNLQTVTINTQTGEKMSTSITPVVTEETNPIEETAIRLRRDAGLYPNPAGPYFNWSGKYYERWFLGRESGGTKQSYYILPDGKVYWWKSRTKEGMISQDVLVAQLDSTHYEDLSWLLETDPVVLRRSFGLYPNPSGDYLNWSEQYNERWFLGKDSDGTKQSYYILPDGKVYRWDSRTKEGMITQDALVAELSKAYHRDLSWLVETDSQVLKQRFNLYPNPAGDYRNWSEAYDERWFLGKDSDGTKQSYYILSDGKVYWWKSRTKEGVMTTEDPVVAQLDTSYYRDLRWLNGITSSSTLTTADVTSLPGNPGITQVAPEGNTSTVSETGRGIVLNYDTNVGGWSGGGFSFDDFSTPSIETQDLSGYSELVFGLKGNTPQVKFEIISMVNGQEQKTSVPLTGIQSDKEQVWAIPTSLLTGVDLTKVRLIYFIVEGANQTGTLEINRIPPSTTPGVIEVWPGDSIQRAIDQAKEGEVIRIHAGTYDESFNLGLKRNLTLEGVPATDGSLPVLTMGSSGAFHLSIHDGTKLKNLIFQNPARRLNLYGYGSNMVIDNVQILSGYLQIGHLYAAGNNNLVQNSVIKDSNTSASPLAVFGDSNRILKNLILYEGFNEYQYGVVHIESDKGGNLLDGNTLVAKKSSSSQMSPENAVYVYRRIYDSTQTGPRQADRIVNTITSGARTDVYSAKDTATVEVSYSLLQSGVTKGNVSQGTGLLLGVDPQFVDPSKEDYHLKSTSPAIDAGDPSSPKDPDGTRADMGALYFHQSLPPVPYGWRRAASNPNYAFRIDSFDPHCGRAGCPKVLQLLNLITTESQDIIVWNPGTGQSLAPIYDVSPDSTPGGPVVVFEVTSNVYEENDIVAQRVDDPAQRLRVPWTLEETEAYFMSSLIDSIEFSKGIALVHKKNGKYLLIDLETLNVIVTGIV